MIAEEFADDPGSSICLGITCKSFMCLHKELNPCPVGLTSITIDTKRCPRWLTYLLKDWFLQGFAYNWETGWLASSQTQQAQGEKYKQAGAKKNQETIFRLQGSQTQIPKLKTVPYLWVPGWPRARSGRKSSWELRFSHSYRFKRIKIERSTRWCILRIWRKTGEARFIMHCLNQLQISIRLQQSYSAREYPSL